MNQNCAKSTFFRQSGWMVLCTVLSGLAFYAVHLFNKNIPASEYAIFVTLLGVLNCMVIPSLGLQMVFTQQTAAALTETDCRKLAQTTRGVLLGTFVIWLLAAAVIFIFRDAIVVGWKLSNPAALWLMLLAGLVTIWLPVFTGLLQGRQNFLLVGWSLISNSVGRIAAVAVIVLVFHGYSAGLAGGILIGTIVTLAISAVGSREVWLTPGLPMEWKAWLARVIPLTLGFGAFQFMFSADPLFVQYYFDKESNNFYMAANTLGRALCTFTVPVVAVMFPKIVRSAALSEKTNLMGLTLTITGGMVGLGALGLCVIAPFFLAHFYNASYGQAIPLVRWFALSMAPLAIANVLLNNLLARSQFKVVPWLVAVAAGYGLALTQFHPSFTGVIQVLGVFNLLFLGIVGFFTWREARVAAGGILKQPAGIRSAEI